jgi:uncharacterized protein YlaI
LAKTKKWKKNNVFTYMCKNLKKKKDIVREIKLSTQELFFSPW